jgi:hypothetical protein
MLLTYSLAGSSMTHLTFARIRFEYVAHATTKKWHRSSLFGNVKAILKLRQEVPMIVETIPGDYMCTSRLSMARRTFVVQWREDCVGLPAPSPDDEQEIRSR